MANEVSKKTVLVLLMLTIVVSAIGTWIAVDSMQPSVISQREDTELGHVSVGINVPAGVPGAQSDSEKGKVSMNIIPN